MRTSEMKIAIELNDGRCVSTEMKDGYEIEKETEKNKTSSIFESELECKIDPNIFAGAWLEEYQPTSRRQKEILHLYQDAKSKSRLHAFTCMTIDPSVKDGKLVYQKGLPIKTGFSQRQWEKMLNDYNPSRNSRQMTRTEYVCRSLFLIQKLVKSGYKIEESWKAICDDSRKIGHYGDSDNPKHDFEPTGSRNTCGFFDLGNVWKLISEDPWDKAGGYWVSRGNYYYYGDCYPVADLSHFYNVDLYGYHAVGMLALD